MKRFTSNIIWLLGAFLVVLVAGCGSKVERSTLIGRWEGSVPLPLAATQQQVPITYIFSEPHLTVAAGIGPDAIVLEFDAWEIERVLDNQVLMHVTAPGGRVFAAWARFMSDDEMMIWDRDREDVEAAVVRRVGPPGIAPEATTTAGASLGTGIAATPGPSEGSGGSASE